jgi:tRNA dimethylallyltransferase
MNKNENKYLIYILGPTAIGKSKLSLELAEKLNCEIINSDAFSFYKGADIMTAKVNEQEKMKIKHHLIDFLELNQTEYNVQNYQKDCLTQLLKLKENQKSVLIVGGSNYYVDSILFERVEKKEALKDNVESIQTEQCQKEFLEKIYKEINLIKSSEDPNNINQNLKEYTEKFTAAEAMLILENIDPKYSNFLHSNDERRVKNCILYYFITGEKKSHKIEKEFKVLRQKNTKVVCLFPEKFENLTKKINSRLGEMVTQGIKEILWIFRQMKDKLNFEKGILQAIGYKEFYPLILQINEDNKVKDIIEKLLDNDASSDEIIKIIQSEIKLSKCLEECVTQLKFNTNNYAKGQMKFIKKKIIPYINSENLLEIEMESSKYEEKLNEIMRFIENNDIGHISDSIVLVKNRTFDNWKTYYCEKCEKVLKGENAYETHMTSRTHKKYKKKLNK